MAILLSVDIGTSKLCVMALDTLTRRPLAVLSKPNDAGIKGLPPEQHEQDPRVIQAACFDLLSTVLKQPNLRGKSISGIGITGQMHGVLLVDANLRPLTNLITWQDGRTVPFIAGWREKIDPAAAQRLGCRIAPGYGGLTLSWLALQDRLPQAALALSISDYLAASLCGVLSSEPTHAASWGIYNLAAGGWDGPTVDALGIPPGVLPKLHPSCTPLGRLTPQAQRALGIPEDVPVCSPLGDNQAAVFGLSEQKPGILVLNLGTGGQISRPRSDPLYQDGLETRPMPFGDYIQVGASLCGGWAYAYLEQFFRAVVREFAGLELDDRQIYERMNTLSGLAQSAGLVVDPRFNGTRLDPTLRGSIYAIDSTNLNPAALTRATVEGMVEELYQLARLTGMQGIDQIVATGNAVRKNPALLEIISTRFGLPCSVSTFTEEAALGAAWGVAVGLGLAG